MTGHTELNFNFGLDFYIIIRLLHFTLYIISVQKVGLDFLNTDNVLLDEDAKPLK